MQNKAEAQPAWLQLAAGSWGCCWGLAELGKMCQNLLKDNAKFFGGWGGSSNHWFPGGRVGGRDVWVVQNGLHNF